MNRRTYIKSILAVGVLGTASYSLFKWLDINQPIDVKSLQGYEPLIAELAEVIIPRTDTPGAKDAFVHQFIIKVILNCNHARQQQIFMRGLEDLEQYTNDQYQQSFLKCSQAQKESVVQYFSDHAAYSTELLNKVQKRLWGQSFFTKFRNLTVEGYCLSEPGATQGLAYDYIPGNFMACVPLQANQKSWATK
ncbi:Twin-arginine translocation pathway signal [Pedobacter sp. BAL39]|uniref:gluconate 2-dehydrogenase subunit 3 family protein n=1 Tax=Pedobacter sp. BAL39 TaxID=391596 RepID=UPI00015595C7|nr:gluconate 2-dehydrogenase subunit 3 family protein [Pedobacter sp. BAL39]EDM38240.1 Twin-arginine translocation pathway signal [Pedobacter sp. BAL39]